MAMAQPKPRIVVSQCLHFDACRYNGQKIEDGFVAKLKGHVDLVPVCPELRIGLGVPRDPIRLVSQKGKLALRQPSTGKDVTKPMTEFATRFLDQLGPVEGFILKSRSPTCGFKGVKIYSSDLEKAAFDNGAGFFAQAVAERYPTLALEDEGRLKNFRIREHFLTKVFCLARFREIETQPEFSQLIMFHAENKFLMMAYHQEQMRRLGRLLGQGDKKQINSIVQDYKAGLGIIFDKMPRYTSHINVLNHSLGYFSKQLSAGEKKYFMEVIENYRNARVPLSQALGILNAWIRRFEQDYLAEQTYFQPYPLELVEITDSGKGR